MTTGPQDFWSLSTEEVLTSLESSGSGLTPAQAAERLVSAGPNIVAQRRRARGIRLLLAQFTSPITLLLIGATIVALVLGDVTDSSIILAIVVASGLLGFRQEHVAGRAVDALVDQVRSSVRVVRGGVEADVPVTDIVPGDVVMLGAGSVVPADCRVLSVEGLLTDESALTGEAYPAAKGPDPVDASAPLPRRRSAVWMGTHVTSGLARVVVVWTGRGTELGQLSERVGEKEVQTSFERGATRFGVLLVWAMAALVTLVLVINFALHRPLIDSLLFSLALAVGLTPQLLPAIVAVSLARGATRMAEKRVVVKRLDALEDFGAMTLLCTDKTGTITEGQITLDSAIDLAGAESAEVLRLARLNAGLQRGFPNPLDLAISAGASAEQGATYIDEVPYDFQRKRLSVLVEQGGTYTLVTKGAVASMLGVCTRAETGGAETAIEPLRAQIQARFEDMSARGLRVIGVATRTLDARTSVDPTDEHDMVLQGLLAFADPPKPSAGEALKQLAALGVAVKIITGDSHLAARYAATAVGLPADPILIGAEIDRLSDKDLASAAGAVSVFAEVDPMHKDRIVRALRATGETVGFLGDGINDAAALHAADVGISVDTAVDVAKQTAAIVLLDKSLAVVADGIALGRQTFANTLKYIRVTISANFGNVLSMAAASAFLPFLPMLPRQILLLNFLSDVPATTISTDSVDPERSAAPESWDVHSIRSFMIVFGLLSSAFDIITFVVLRVVFHASTDLFRSAWFIESTVTELVAMLVLRTNRLFWRSVPSKPLILSSLVVFVITVILPYSPFAKPLALTSVPVGILASLAGLTVVYVLVNELAKGWTGMRKPAA